MFDGFDVWQMSRSTAPPPSDALGHGQLKRFLACITDNDIGWIRGTSTKFVLERKREEAQLSVSKHRDGHLQCRTVVAVGQFRMD